MTNARTYRDAATRLEHTGWVQRRWFNKRGNECLVQAIGRVLGSTKAGEITVRLPVGVVAPLVQALGLTPTAHTEEGLAAALWQWNDQPDRTFDEVVGLLRRAAAEDEARETGTYVPATWASLLPKGAKMIKELVKA